MVGEGSKRNRPPEFYSQLKMKRQKMKQHKMHEVRITSCELVDGECITPNCPFFHPPKVPDQPQQFQYRKEGEKMKPDHTAQRSIRNEYSASPSSQSKFHIKPTLKLKKKNKKDDNFDNFHGTINTKKHAMESSSYGLESGDTRSAEDLQRLSKSTGRGRGVLPAWMTHGDSMPLLESTPVARTENMNARGHEQNIKSTPISSSRTNIESTYQNEMRSVEDIQRISQRTGRGRGVMPAWMERGSSYASSSLSGASLEQSRSSLGNNIVVRDYVACTENDNSSVDSASSAEEDEFNADFFKPIELQQLSGVADFVSAIAADVDSSTKCEYNEKNAQYENETKRLKLMEIQRTSGRKVSNLPSWMNKTEHLPNRRDLALSINLPDVLEQILDIE
jgi:hypothetical protein